MSRSRDGGVEGVREVDPSAPERSSSPPDRQTAPFDLLALQHDIRAQKVAEIATPSPDSPSGSFASRKLYSEAVRKPSQATLFELARGGMGRVDLVSVRDGTFLRLHAIKRLHVASAEDPEFRQMFLDEARIAGLIRHANVVSVLDVDEDANGPFLVMDYVEGVSLKQVIVHHHKKKELMPIQLCARIASQIAQGLHAAHELTTPAGKSLELVHRDVSPQNVILGFDGVVRVTDFGVAKSEGRSTRTSAGVLKGKLGYFSPEQLRFEEPDRRSDLFALGVILYELLTAERLYANKNGTEGAHRTLSEPPPDVGEARADVPPALVELMFELLAKNPDERPATARDVARRLDAIVSERSGMEGPLELSEYMEATFGDLRSQMRERIAKRLDELDPVAAESVRADSGPIATLPASTQPSPASLTRPSPSLDLSSVADTTSNETPSELTKAALTQGSKPDLVRERGVRWRIPVVVVSLALGVFVVMSRRSETAPEPSIPPPSASPASLPTETQRIPSPPPPLSSQKSEPVGAKDAAATPALEPAAQVRPRAGGSRERDAKPKDESPAKAKPTGTSSSPFDGLGARE